MGICRCQHDKGQSAHALFPVRHTDHCHLGDSGVDQERVYDVIRVDVLAAVDQHALHVVSGEEDPVVVDIIRIAGGLATADPRGARLDRHLGSTYGQPLRHAVRAPNFGCPRFMSGLRWRPVPGDVQLVMNPDPNGIE